MAALLDTNVLVYRYDPSDPRKQQIAAEVVRRGVLERSVQLPHQAVMEFMSVVTKPRGIDPPLLTPEAARRETEELLSQFTVLYPNDALVRLALRGAAMYQLSWFDAHIWAYAEHFGLDELLSEDFQHGRDYGTVRVVNPFIDAG